MPSWLTWPTDTHLVPCHRQPIHPLLTPSMLPEITKEVCSTEETRLLVATAHPGSLVVGGKPGFCSTSVGGRTSIGVLYKIMHFFFSFFRVSRAARVACSNTSRTPSLVLAEHSRYFCAPIFLQTSSA